MPALLPDVDPDGLLEYSVVYTDRALNHMSRRFQGVMRDVSATLKQVYAAQAAVVVPGSGSTGMEAVARQFATGRKVLIIRNGWFSYRWSQIFEMGGIPAATTVLKARMVSPAHQAPFAPPPLDEVVATIRSAKPDLVFAPHVETSAGMLLPDDYLTAVAAAVHEHGGLFVLDCIASGAIWVDMAATGVDVLVSAPQKGWLQIMQTYESGGHAYHATLPTDGLARLRDVMQELAAFGFDRAKVAQQQLGDRVRALLAHEGIASVAASGFQSPGVVVSYTDDVEWHSGRAFAALGLQIAAGVPLAVDEPADFRTFRIGLFGLDKLMHVDRTVENLDRALSALL